MKKLCLFLIILLPLAVFSQDKNISFPGELKISGYLQSQFQKAQSTGIKSWSGGDFNKNSDSRFMIRRGRLKVERFDQFSTVAIQLDGTQDGVKLMDAFIQLHHPQNKSLLFTAGLFNRPFGYAVGYSSSQRDFPERPRVFQTVMPRERDLGAMLTFVPQHKFSFITAELAFVNGSGINAKDYDSNKDVIGNLSFKFDSLANPNFSIAFGGSIYNGSVRSNTDTYLKPTQGGFSPVTGATNKNLKRNYYGANLQLRYNSGFGATTFKTEYIQGVQPGISTSSSVSGLLASQSFTTQPTGDLYLRNFNGYVFWLTQQIASSKLTAIVGYDVYDPNIDIKENEIGLAGSNTSAGDIKFRTLGYGLAYCLSDRIKLTVYNEHVYNDNTMLADYKQDVKDNVFTARLQYRW